MLQFIPFEDDWDALERMSPEALVPYRVGLLPEPAPAARAAGIEAVPADALRPIASMAAPGPAGS